MKKILVSFLIMILFISLLTSAYAMDDWANVRTFTIFKYLFYNPVNEGESHESEYYNVYYFIDPNTYDPNDKDRFDATVKQALNNKVLYIYPGDKTEYRFLVGGYLLASYIKKIGVDNLALAYSDGLDKNSELLIEAKYALGNIIDRLKVEIKKDKNSNGNIEFDASAAKLYEASKKIVEFSQGDISLDVNSINSTESNINILISFLEDSRRIVEQAYTKAGGIEDEDRKKEDEQNWKDNTQQLKEDAQQIDKRNTAPLYYFPTKTTSKNDDNKNTDIDTIVSSANTFINNKEKENVETIKEQDIKNLSDTIYNILLIIGVIIAVLVGAIIGIKFMTGSIEEKANIKELLIPYIVGCIVVFGAFGIWKLAVLMLNNV